MCLKKYPRSFGIVSRVRVNSKIREPEYISKYYFGLGIIFVTLLLTANIIGEKPLAFGFIILPAGQLLFPLTYLLGDVLTEVYGFMAARRIIWSAMVCNLFMAFMCQVAIALPSIEGWQHEEAYRQIFSHSARLMVASVVTYFIGELFNAYIVYRLKAKMKGRLFWLRALCSSSIGECIETSFFIPLAFYGTMENHELFRLALFYYCFKISYAACIVPFANKLANFLKKCEMNAPEYYNRGVAV